MSRPWYIGAKAAQGGTYCYAYLNVRTDAYRISVHQGKLQLSRQDGGHRGVPTSASTRSRTQSAASESPRTAGMYILEPDGRYVTTPDPCKLMNERYIFADEIGLSRAGADVPLKKSGKIHGVSSA